MTGELSLQPVQSLPTACQESLRRSLREILWGEQRCLAWNQMANRAQSLRGNGGVEFETRLTNIYSAGIVIYEQVMSVKPWAKDMV